MRSAVDRVDVVGKTEYLLPVRRVVLHRDLYLVRIGPVLDIDRLLVDHVPVLIEEINERDDTARVVEFVLLPGTFVCKQQVDAGVEEGQLADSKRQRVEAVFERAEDLAARHEPYRRSGLLLFILLRFRCEFCFRFAILEPLRVDLPVAVDLDLEPFGESVDNRDTDAVQAAGDLVTVVVEFAAGMQGGHHDLDCRLLLCRVHVDRDAAAVIGYGDIPFLRYDNLDRRAVSRHRFIDRVVDHLIDHVMKAMDVGASDIHRRALAHRL